MVLVLVGVNRIEWECHKFEIFTQPKRRAFENGVVHFVSPFRKQFAMTWTLDSSKKVWKCSSYSDLHYAAINNLAEYGQPKSPYERGFDHNFVPDFANVIVEMTQLEVMTNGYGRDVKVESFPIVNRFLSEKLPLGHGNYDFDQLVRAGFAKKSERWIKSNLYGWGGYGVQAGSIDSADAAYIHGTISLALLKATRFISSPGLRRIDAEMGAGDDNWDFNSSSIQRVVNAAVATLFGPDHYNLEAPIQIRFRGHGRRASISKRV